MNPKYLNNALIVMAIVITTITFVKLTEKKAVDNTKNTAKIQEYSDNLDKRFSSSPAMVIDPETMKVGTRYSCEEFSKYNARGEYENIGAMCFDYFHITDEMLVNRLETLFNNTPYNQR